MAAVERGSLRWLFVLVSALALGEVMFYSVLAPLLPYYSHRLHLSKGAAGLLSASYAIGALVFALPVGVLVARVGAKRATVASALLLAGASIAFGESRTLGELEAARFVQGIAGAGVWTAALSWLIAVAPSHRRGETVGAVLGIAIAGALLGPVIGSLAELSEPRLVFGAVAVMLLALAACALATPPPPTQPPQSASALRAAAKDGRLLAGVWLTALPATLAGVLYVLAPLRLNALGADTVAVGAVFLAAAAVEAAASPLFGRLSDRRGALPVIRIGLACCAAVALALPLPNAAWLLGVVTVLAGISFGMSWVPAGALLSAAVEAQGCHQSLAYSLWNLAWAAGIVLGSAVGAPLAQATGDAVPYVLLAALFLATLAATMRRRSLAGSLG
jgi:predicted MFS family arabinose efflux permease